MNNINWGKVPDELTMEQFYKLCHVSKKTARYLLRSGKIPCKYTGKRTHSYTIRKEDVIAFLEDREQYPEAYKAPPGWYSGGYDPRSHHDSRIAATPVVQEPSNGSKTKSPGAVNALISLWGTATGNWHGCSVFSM